MPKDVEVVYCSASEKYCIIICLKSSRSTLSKPSKAQATPIPAFSVYCKIENCKKIDQNLLPIKDWDSQEERNPWVSLKAKVIQASTQLNPVREILFLVFLVTQLRSWVSVRPNCTTIGVWSIRNINSKPKLVAILLWWQPLINSLFFRFQFGNNASDLHSAPISHLGDIFGIARKLANLKTLSQHSLSGNAMAYSRCQQSNIWQAHLEGWRNNNSNTKCHDSHNSLESNAKLQFRILEAHYS